MPYTYRYLFNVGCVYFQYNFYCLQYSYSHFFHSLKIAIIIARFNIWISEYDKRWLTKKTTTKINSFKLSWQQHIHFICWEHKNNIFKAVSLPWKCVKYNHCMTDKSFVIKYIYITMVWINLDLYPLKYSVLKEQFSRLYCNLYVSHSATWRGWWVFKLTLVVNIKHKSYNMF